MSRLLLIGGGGHCASVADCLLSSGTFEQIGIVDITGRPVLGVPIVGTDADLPRLKEEGWTDAFITVGSVGNTAIRRRLYEKMKALGFHIPAVIDPTAVNHQGEDTGIQYRTGIYYTQIEDAPVIDEALHALAARYDQPLAVEHQPLENFYPAEEYHQKYLDKNPGGYCHIPRRMFHLEENT